MWRQPAKQLSFISLRGKAMNAWSAKPTYGQRLRELVQIHPVSSAASPCPTVVTDLLCQISCSLCQAQLLSNLAQTRS